MSEAGGWHYWTATRLLAAYRASEADPRAVVDHYLARIAAHDPVLNAFTAVTREEARAAAAESERRWTADEARALEGVPVAVKANIDVAGVVTHAAVAAWRGRPPAQHDAPIVARLRAAGAVVLGQLNMHEAAFGATSEVSAFGSVHNPHRLGFTPGGSSGGSGAAVAAGLCAVALGTDTSGSARLPAAHCGVYGLKPTTGLLSLDGVVPLAKRLDTVGPLARSVDDLALMMDEIVDLPGRPQITSVALLSAVEEVEIEPEVTAAYRNAADSLRTAGLAVEKHRCAADLNQARLANLVEAGRELDRHPDRGKGFSEAIERTIAWARDCPVHDVARYERARDAAVDALHAALLTHGAVLTPTAPTAAFAHGGPARISQPVFTALASQAGLPALALPVGLTFDGLPLSVQLIGRAGSDCALIALARRLDRALGGCHPPPLFA